MLSWPERFEHHIEFVCETYLDYAHLIALCLNWPADIRAALGYDASFIARAKRVFNRALQETEEELEDSATAKRESAKKQKKSAPKKSLGASSPSILQMAMSEGYSGADEEPDQSDDDGGGNADHGVVGEFFWGGK